MAPGLEVRSVRRIKQIDPGVSEGFEEDREPGIVDFGERDLAPPGFRRRQLPRWMTSGVTIPTRVLAALGGIALVAVLSASSLLGVSIVPVDMAALNPTATPPPTPSPRVDPTPSRAPGASPLPSPAAEGTAPPFNATGWPIELPSSWRRNSLEEGGSVGPDGTIYIPGVVPISPLGYGRVGWLLLSDGRHLTPRVFSSDGGVFGYAFGPEGIVRVWGFGSDGQVRFEYWTGADSAPYLKLGPGGDLYVLERPSYSRLAPASGAVMLILDRSGNTKDMWWLADAWGSDFIVRSDGSILAEVSEDGFCRLHAFSAGGTDLTSGPDPCWEHLAVGPTGTVVGWSYTSGTGGTPVVNTRIAIIGQDGRPEPGWPRVIAGTASPPGFGPGGSIYLNVLHGWSGLSELQKLELGNSSDPAWSVSLAAGPLTTGGGTAGDPVVPESPLVAPDGTAFVAETRAVSAYDTNGAPLSGWPYRLPIGWSNFLAGGPTGQPAWNPGPLLVDASGSGGSKYLLYLALSDRIVALETSGGVAAGWPYLIHTTGFESWSDWSQTPDGGLIALARYSGAGGHYVLYSLTSGGSRPV
jgi:hypothetical protein